MQQFPNVVHMLRMIWKFNYSHFNMHSTIYFNICFLFTVNMKYFLLILFTLGIGEGFRCPREPLPEQSAVLKSPGDNGFQIMISGDPEKYVPGSVYTRMYKTSL